MIRYSVLYLILYPHPHKRLTIVTNKGLFMVMYIKYTSLLKNIYIFKSIIQNGRKWVNFCIMDRILHRWKSSYNSIFLTPATSPNLRHAISFIFLLQFYHISYFWKHTEICSSTVKIKPCIDPVITGHNPLANYMTSAEGQIRTDSPISITYLFYELSSAIYLI